MRGAKEQNGIIGFSQCQQFKFISETKMLMAFPTREKEKEDRQLILNEKLPAFVNRAK